MSDTKISNVIGVPIPQWLVNQFNERANQNGQTYRDTESLVYLSNKSAWVRAVSSVNVSNSDMEFFSKNYGITQTDPTSLAKSFILFAGTSKYRKESNNGFGYDLRAGLGDSYGMLGEQEVNRYGYQPMPGITSVNIETAGRMGSVRMATVNFKVHNKMQLDIIDALYFKLGYTLFLEWANTYYYETDNEEELQEFNSSNSYKKPALKSTEDLSIDPFEDSLTKEKINYRIAQNVKKSYGNYDGMLGVITNFNFTRKEDSSYDCSIKIIGLGALAESIRINRSDVFVDVLKDELKKIVQTANSRKSLEVRAKTNEFDEAIKNAKGEIAKINEEINSTKSIDEIYVEKVRKNRKDIKDYNSAIDYIRNNITYIPSDVYDKYAGDIVYGEDDNKSWAIRKFGKIIDGTNKENIEEFTLSSLNIKKSIKTSSNIFNIAEEDVDPGSEIAYDGDYNLIRAFKIPYFNNEGIKKNYNLYIIIANRDYPPPIDSERREKLGEAIYKDLTEKDKTIKSKIVFKLLPTSERTSSSFLSPFKLRASLSGVTDVVIEGEEIPYFVNIEDSGLLIDIKIDEEEKKKIITRELLKIESEGKIEEIQQGIADKENQKNQTVEDNPLADVNKVQEIEGNKYASSLESILRGIQTYSLNRATDTVISVTKVDLKKDLAPKIFGRVGLYSTMYDKLIRGSIEDIVVEKTDKKIFEIPSGATQQSILEYFAKYGFNHNIMSGNAKPSKDEKVNYENLLVSYVIPHQISQEFAEGITMNRPVFIQFGTLLMILNHISLIYDVKDKTKKENRTPVIYLDYNPNTNYCLTVPNHLSANPIDFFIPYTGTKKDFESLLDPKVKDKIKNIFDPKSKDNNFSGDIPVFRDRSLGNEKSFQGRIMNVLVDIQYLLSTIKRFSTSDATNSVYLKSFIESILSDMTKALGNFNILRLAYDDASNCLFIVDDQLTPGDSKEEKAYRSQPTNKTEIPLHGKRSIAKNIEIKTDISSKLANMIAISSNAPSSQGSLSTDASSFGFVNANFTDRYIPLKEDVDTKKPDDKKEAAIDTTEGDIEVAQSFNDAIKSFYGAVDISGDSVQTTTNYYMARMSRVKNETSASRASVMIPVSVNFTTDGVSGFGMYQSFTINDELLPYTYSTYNKNGISDNKLKKVGFCVVGLSHTIESNQWNTSVRAQMVYLKDSIDYKTNPIVEKLPSGPGKVSPNESIPSESSIIEEELASNLENSLAFKEKSQNIKWQLQRGDTWCYIASVSMILNSYGKPVSQESINNRFNDSEGKLDSIGVANSYGIRYSREALPNGNIDLSYNTIINRIQERKGKPFILERKGSGSKSHFVVVLSVDNQNRIVVFDPSESKYAGGTYLNKQNLKTVGGSLRFFDL